MEKELKKLTKRSLVTINQKDSASESFVKIEINDYGHLFSVISGIIKVSNFALYEIGQNPNHQDVNLMNVYHTLGVADQLISSLENNEADLLDNLKNQLTQSN